MNFVPVSSVKCSAFIRFLVMAFLCFGIVLTTVLSRSLDCISTNRSGRLLISAELTQVILFRLTASAPKPLRSLVALEHPHVRECVHSTAKTRALQVVFPCRRRQFAESTRRLPRRTKSHHSNSSTNSPLSMSLTKINPESRYG